MDSYIDLNYVLSDNFSFSDVPELELSCSESEESRLKVTATRMLALTVARIRVVQLHLKRM